MNRRNRIIRAISLGLMLILPLSSLSAPKVGETVTKRGAINDDYYAAGGSVDIDAEIAGDVVASGGDLFIAHHIQDDVMAAGGSIKIRGEVLDDVRSAGGEIDINATIGDDLFIAGGTIRVSSASSIGGGAWLAGGDVHMAGTINNGLSVKAGTIRLSGTIHGDVTLQAGEIEILQGALIEGDLHYKSPKEAKIDPDAKINGEVTYQRVEWDHPHRGYGIFFSLTLVVASVALFLLFPGFTLSAAGRVSAEPLKSLGLGFAVLVITPIAAIVLMGTVLGLWVGLTLLAFILWHCLSARLLLASLLPIGVQGA